MTVEGNNSVSIVRGSKEEIEKLKSHPALVRDEEVCVIMRDETPAEMEPKMMVANIPEDGYYKEKIKNMTIENEKLITENARLNEQLMIAMQGVKEKEERIRKLEAALIEAAIR